MEQATLPGARENHATVMDAVKGAGITNVSIVTQPLEQNAKH